VESGEKTLSGLLGFSGPQPGGGTVEGEEWRTQKRFLGVRRIWGIGKTSWESEQRRTKDLREPRLSAHKNILISAEGGRSAGTLHDPALVGGRVPYCHVKNGIGRTSSSVSLWEE